MRPIRLLLVAFLALVPASAPLAATVVTTYTTDNSTDDLNPQLHIDIDGGIVSRSLANVADRELTLSNFTAGTISYTSGVNDYALTATGSDGFALAVGEGVDLTGLTYDPKPSGTTYSVTLRSDATGPWNPLPRRAYVALQIHLASGVHYGWLDLRIDAAGRVEVVASAFENVPQAVVVTPAHPLATAPSSWGRIKGLYERR